MSEAPVASEDWELVNRSYPYVGEAGETVCADFRRADVSGRTALQSEFYHLDKINETLATDAVTGQLGAVDDRVRKAIRARGISRVKTCDDARKFMRYQAEALEAEPSLVPVPSEGSVTENDVPAEVVDKVANSINASVASSVSVWRWRGPRDWVICSGALLDRYRLLTAAHCFPANGAYTIWVDFGWGTQCISPPCEDPASGTPAKNALVSRYPGFLGSNDPSRDLALVSFANGGQGWLWPGSSSANWIALAAAPISAYWVVGYGTNAYDGSAAGWSRYAFQAQTVDWWGTDYWLSYTESGVGRPCVGDSGAPGVFTGAGFNMANGFVSGGDVNPGDACPRPGAKFRYTRIEAKLSWIESIIGPCGRFIDNGYINMRCD